MPNWLTQIFYLVSAVLFIVGIKRLNSPATARRATRSRVVGMLIAMAVTLFDQAIVFLRRDCHGRGGGHRARPVASLRRSNDSDAADGGPAQRIWRWCVAAVGAAEFLRAHESSIAIPNATGSSCSSACSWRGDAHGQPDRVRQAPGDDARPTDYVSRPQRGQCLAVRGDCWISRLAGVDRSPAPRAVLFACAPCRWCSA